MCLIISRPANKELDFDKFKVAIENNDDGFGLSAPDGNNGKLLTLRDHNKVDPENLFKLVQEELIDVPILLHLRYTTVGATSLRNAHPFPILEKSKDGIDLRMAHNGTLPRWKPTDASGMSDTRVFVRSFVRPLFKRMAKAMDPELLLKDNFLHFLLDDQLTQRSVLSFIDGNGETLEVNAKGAGGDYIDDVYYSNKYSFTPGYRKKEEQSNWSGYQGQQGNYSAGYQSNSNHKKTAKEKGYGKGMGDTMVEKFSEKNSIPVANFGDMTDGFIHHIVMNKPEDTQLLIKETLYELEKSWDKEQQMRARIKALTEQVQKLEGGKK